MTRTEALVALNMSGIGISRLKKLLQYCNQPQDIFAIPTDKLKSVINQDDNLFQRIASFKTKDLALEFKQAEKLGLRIVTFEDAEYPENLKNIPGLPVVLYIKGRIEKQDNLALGVVGSRQASFYGLVSTAKLVSELVANNFTIISGMARGIDTCAHKAALKSAGRTLAVMGSGFNNIYPPENKELAEDISKHGAVISEFPINEKPLKVNFPRRNRIISGISLGVLVSEAAKNSGAIITADFALEQGREVFALPGKIDASGAFGTNELIKQGAKLVTQVEDILTEFNICANKEMKKEGADSCRLKKEEDVLYELILDHAIPLDELAEKSKMTVASLCDNLLSLQLKKLIKQLPGKQFIRNQPFAEALGADMKGTAG